MTSKTPLTIKLTQNFKVSSLAVLMVSAMLGNAHADRAARYRPFPSVQYYDVDKELRKLNINPDGGDLEEDNKKSSDAASLQNSVFVVEQELSSFLKLAAQQNEVRANVSPKLKGTIRNTELPSTIDDMLAVLSDQFDFDWYQDGRMLYVSDRSENTTKVISLANGSYKQLKKTLKSIGLKGTGYSMKYVEDSNSVMVTGPASLIAKVEILVASKAENNSGPTLIEYGKEQ